MSSMTVALLPATTVTADMEQDPSRIVDLGAYRHLEVLINVLVASSTGGTIKLQTNVRNEPDGWVDISGVSLSLTSTGAVLKSSSSFLRYVRWITDANVDGTPVVQIDLVAKE